MGASLDPGLLAALVVGGVGLVAALTHLTGGTVTLTLQGEDDARERFGIDFPDVGVDAVTLADDRRAALLQLRGGDTGLVFSLGDGIVTRRLSRAPSVRDLGDALLIRLGEFGAPAVRVRLADGEQRRRWGARVGGEAA